MDNGWWQKSDSRQIRIDRNPLYGWWQIFHPQSVPCQNQQGAGFEKDKKNVLIWPRYARFFFIVYQSSYIIFPIVSYINISSRSFPWSMSRLSKHWSRSFFAQLQHFLYHFCKYWSGSIFPQLQHFCCIFATVYDDCCIFTNLDLDQLRQYAKHGIIVWTLC